jgi:peptidylprolyl isomerase
VIAGFIGTTLVGVSAYLASGCSDHPDAVANRFYAQLAALDISGMAQLECEDDRIAFRESVAFVESIPHAKPLELEEFDARTERSDGTAVAMRVSARFVDTERGEEMEVSTRVTLIRKDGEWCISGEEDGFRSVSESAADVFALLVRGGISRGRGFDFPEDARSIPVQVVTPPPAGPPEIGGEIVTTDSGLQYIEIEEGTGQTPEPGQTLLVHYKLWLASGEHVETSLDGEPIEFELGRGMVIAGWEEGLATMREHGMRRLVVRPELAYGEAGQGAIQPNSTLIFDVELVEIR